MKVTYVVLIKSLQISLIVGTALVLINHYGIIFGDRITKSRFIQILMCFAVPFGVSLYSQLSAARQRQSDRRQSSDKDISGR